MKRPAAWLMSRKTSDVWRVVAAVQLAAAAIDVATGSNVSAAVMLCAAAASRVAVRTFKRIEARAELPEARTRSKRP